MNDETVKRFDESFKEDIDYLKSDERIPINIINLCNLNYPYPSGVSNRYYLIIDFDMKGVLG